MSDEPTDLIARLQQNISRVVLGKADAVRLAVVALLAGEHVLLEDVPGVGKTLVGKAIARSLAGRFPPHPVYPRPVAGRHHRQQPLQQSDARVHSSVLARSSPTWCLADEINRATPRTQSALLESMSERQVSADGQTHALPRPFMVIATQNPVEFEGTYPLPESQFDRFLLRIPLGYPERGVELQVLTSHREGEPVDSLAPVLDCEQVSALQAAVRQVAIEDSINQYVLGHCRSHAALRRVARRREHPRGVGALPRGPGGGVGRRSARSSCPTTSSSSPSRSWPIASFPRAICTAVIARRSNR